MELKHKYKEQKIVKRRSIMHKKINIWALIYQNSACNIFTKTKVQSVNRIIKTCSLDFCILFFCMLRKNKLFTDLKFLTKWCFVGQPKFSITAQRKLKSAPAPCAVDSLQMFLMLVPAPPPPSPTGLKDSHHKYISIPNLFNRF